MLGGIQGWSAGVYRRATFAGSGRCDYRSLTPDPRLRFHRHTREGRAIRAEVYPISGVPAGRLAIMPRPRAGDWLEDEVASWRRSGLDVVVCLLEDGEIAELGLELEAELCRQGGLRFTRLPIPDRGVPESFGPVSALVRTVVAERREGRGVGIHCRIGVGRSAVVAACVMAALGVPVETAWSSLHRARGLSVPDTDAQRAWASAWLTDFLSENVGHG